MASDPDSITIVYSIVGGADAGEVQDRRRHRRAVLQDRRPTSRRRPMPAPTTSTRSSSRPRTATRPTRRPSPSRSPTSTRTAARSSPRTAAAPRRRSTSPRTPRRSPRSRRPTPTPGTTLTYSITGGADAAKFTINADDRRADLRRRAELRGPDRRRRQQRLRRHRAGLRRQPLTDTQAIAVTVTNVNDTRRSSPRTAAAPTAAITSPRTPPR